MSKEIKKKEEGLEIYQPKKEVVRLTKHQFFNDLQSSLEDYEGIELTVEQANKLHKRMAAIKTGATAAIPLICSGPLCPMKSKCVFFETKTFPLAKPCPLETSIHVEFMNRYIEEFDVDPNNLTEIGFINELVEVDILQMRLNVSLSKAENAELMIDQPGTIAEDGTVYYKKEISPLLDAKEKLANRKAKIIKLMVGDRQEKYKKEAALKVRTEKEASSKMSDLRRKIDTLTAELNRHNPELDDEDITILSPEDIIDSDD